MKRNSVAFFEAPDLNRLNCKLQTWLGDGDKEIVSTCMTTTENGHDAMFVFFKEQV